MKIKTGAFWGLLVLLLVVLLWWRGTYTAPRVNDADLRFVRPAIPESENAYFYLDRGVAAMYYPETLQSELEALIKSPYRTAIDTIVPDLRGRTLDEVAQAPELAADISRGNQETLSWLAKATDCRHLLVPEPNTLEDEFAYVKDYRILARIMIVQARVSYHDGQPQDAIRQLLKVVKLGDMLEDSGGCFFHFVVGRALKNSGYAQLRLLATAPSLPDSHLRALSTELERLSVNQRAFTNALKVEYQTLLNTLRHLPNSRAASGFTYVPPAARTWMGGLFIREAKTRSLLSEKIRLVLRYSNANYCDVPVKQWAPPRPDFPQVVRMVLSGNPVGEAMAGMMPWSSFNAALLEEEVSLTATRLLVALRLYSLKKGALPASLQELVPDYLKEVPKDRFDGQPFRYLPDKKMIYSVGRALKDDHGLGNNKNSQSHSIRFPIDF